MEKPEGEAIQADRPMESYTIVCRNISWARKVGFSYESMQDAKKGGNLVMNTVGTWSRGLVRTKEKHYAKFFNYGAYTAGHAVFNNTITGVVTDASGDKIYDGQPFFSTAHPDKVGNTYSNFNSSSALSFSNLQTAYTVFTVTNAKDERGEVIDIAPNAILINPTLKFTVETILNTTNIPGSQDNDTNVMRNIVTPVEWSFFTDTDAWVLMTLKQGIMATEREDVSIDFWMDEETMDYYARIFCRFGGCVTNWRNFYAANLATS